MYLPEFGNCHPHSQKSYGGRIANIAMKDIDASPLNGCRAWIYAPVATGTVEVQKGGKNERFNQQTGGD